MHFQPIENGSAESHPEEGHVIAVEMDPAPHQDPLDDVFGADSPPHHDRVLDHQHTSHPSDMRRLETDHTTAGYREGLTAAKASSVQAGFDEGFSLGAALGQVAGQILGTIEGVEEALRGTDQVETSASVAALLAEAREELRVERLFAAEYWAPDGNWKYDVKSRGDHSGDDEGDVLFDDVAAQHPLVSRWIAIVDGLLETWQIDRAVLEDESEPRVDAAGAETSAAPSAASAAAAPKQALDW
ncbi:ABC1 domain containing protein [Sarocladium implicatum]|nr:ABC1 domain containing protein [Sarocladium implicatum]